MLAPDVEIGNVTEKNGKGGLSCTVTVPLSGENPPAVNAACVRVAATLTGTVEPSGFCKTPLQFPVMGGMGMAVTVPLSSQLDGPPVTVYVPVSKFPVPVRFSVMTSPFMATEVRVSVSPEKLPEKVAVPRGLRQSTALKMVMLPGTEAPV